MHRHLEGRRRAQVYIVQGTSQKQALRSIEKSEHLRWPAKMRKDERRQRSSRYCNFHKDRGHTTEECRQLRDEIERFTRLGYMKQEDGITPNEREKGKIRMDEGVSPQRKDIGPQPRRKIVNVIEGG
ncbi:hypothetical protein Salat_2920200 [Sesamum alatum]|uniref:Reverse transcriptase domain-containing protein n=1 Tax=Sesamum alatum TaxID=300844 RepID=A0AAE2C8L3_9LAMI|nr:hypothetical protein Salat_2920200 [Sesamum alatum]